MLLATNLPTTEATSAIFGLLVTELGAIHIHGTTVSDGRLAMSLGLGNLMVQSKRRLLHLLLLHHVLGVLLLLYHEMPLLLLLLLILLADMCYFRICEGYEFVSTDIGVPAREKCLQPGRDRKG